MNTVRRLLYAEIVYSVVFVALAFLSLFFFIDFVDELGDVGTKEYSVLHAALYTLLLLPRHLYELFPIAVLIGAIYALSRLAQSSEFTVLRTSGLGPGRALGLLGMLGFFFAVFTFIVGDYLAPLSETQAAAVHTNYRGSYKFERAGAWIKDHRRTPEGERSYSVSVGSAASDGELLNIHIYEFDADGRLVARIAAEQGQVDADATWQLKQASVTRWSGSNADGLAQVREEKFTNFAWPSTLSPRVVAAAVLPVTTMSTLDLFRYISHLANNEQAAQRYEIQFWKRALYPLACLVMVALALPFAYLQARDSGLSVRVFGGIMLGISFVLLNNVTGHLGLLHEWAPWAVAATPSALYLLMSLAAFSWLVRYR
ncbi:MAG: LPS export ABC transporter permease LptG [Burkholderiaceae bacterium]|nr:LPS export ABC transporter permease LptG [Burkholderiaceae bacterium]MDH3460237.1 LPS export ABC transporter permease LptG [Burkholderiaceae bacterium]